MSDIQSQIATLLAQRAGIDAKLIELQAQAVSELEAARANVAALEAVLKPQPKQSRPSPAQPIDETDAGRGVRESQDDVSAEDFIGSLAALRERTAEKRRRLS